ncbi:MAG: hypothetical protein AB2604_17290 [Candidatus Thiodiazotropha taylori]
MIDALEEQILKVDQVDLRQAESMLTVQAHALDVIFNHMARRALNVECINLMEGFLKLA